MHQGSSTIGIALLTNDIVLVPLRIQQYNFARLDLTMPGFPVSQMIGGNPGTFSSGSLSRKMRNIYDDRRTHQISYRHALSRLQTQFIGPGEARVRWGNKVCWRVKMSATMFVDEPEARLVWT